MNGLNNKKPFQLTQWTEIIGIIFEIITDEKNLHLTIDDKVLSYRKDSKEAQYIQHKLGGFIGKPISLIKTDSKDEPILFRLLS